jgi:CBS domain-containing protein
MKCSDVMTQSPVCCIGSDTVVKAAQMMSASDVGSVPVIDSERNKLLLGIVTDRDLTLKVLGENRDPKATLIEDVMTFDPATCYPGDDLSKAMDIMSEYQIRRVPVIDIDGRIIGIISQADIALYTHNAQKTAEVVQEISKPELQTSQS